MPRRLASPIASFLVVAATTCHAQSVELKPFSAKDEWTFRQESTSPAGAPATNEIRFSTIFKNKNGDSVLAWAKALMDNGTAVWELLGPLPSAECVRDFVGKDNLGLPNSCKDGLTVGKEWQSTSDDRGATEQITFAATGYEAVNVKAGSFNTLKMIGKGKRLNLDKSTDEVTVTYWFAPEIKAMARTVREYRTPDGKLRAMIVEELVAAKVK